MSKLHNVASTLLGNVALESSVEELRGGIALKEQHTNRRLLARIGEVVNDPSEFETEPDRVFLARILVALLPQSLPFIERLLRPADQGNHVAELQFSLFVALSELQEFGSESEMPVLLSVIGDYLREVKNDDMQAAWMAGDLLGDHWHLEDSLPVLFAVTVMAHAPGREAALHGLSHALDRGTKKQQWEIMAVVGEVAKNDSDPSIRSYAAAIGSSLRGL